jgi:hypothetical protein
LGDIEDGIPIPERKRGRPPSDVSIKVRAMKVGDSCSCTEAEAKTAQALAFHLGMMIERRRMGGGYRIWRTK